MRNTNLMRIVLCGFVAGVVWFALSSAFLSIFAQDLLAVVQRDGPYPKRSGAFFFAVDLLMGVWAVWLYSAISPKYGAGPKTAAIAGVAWWTIKSLQSAKWAGLGFVQPGVVLVPLATTLIAALVAAVVGGWLYQRTEVSTAKILHS